MQRILSLDRLRLVALLGVLFYHLSPGLVPGGYLGVNIFFALAGFLTLFQLLERGREQGEDRGGKTGHSLHFFLESAFAKLKKLYPALLITLFLSCLFIFILAQGSLGDVRSSVFSSIFSVNNYEQVFSGSDYFANTGKLAPFTHLWALAMELQVYLLFFALASKIRALAKTKKGLKKLFLILLGLSLASYLYSLILLLTGSNFSRIYYDTFARLHSFSLGALSGLLTYLSKRLKKQRPQKGPMMVLLVLTVLPFFILKPGTFAFAIGLFLYSIVAAILLFLLYEVENREIPRLDKYTNYFAERSYIIFLWHYPLIEMMDKVFANSKVGALVYFPLFFLLCFGLSEATYRFIKALKNTRILYILTLLMAIALLLAPYEALSGSKGREEVMKSVLKNEKLMEERKKQLEAEQAEDKTEVKEKGSEGEEKNAAESSFWTKMTGPADKHREGNKSSDKTSDEDSRKDAKPEEDKKTKTEEELKAELAESLTYETALSFLEETNELHPDVAVSVEDFNRLHLKDFLFIGDSIGSMSYHTLYAYLPKGTYDSNHSRQMNEAPAFLQNYLKTQPAPELIFVQLGTNAGVDKKDVDALRALAPDSKFFLYSTVLPDKSEEDARNQAIYAYIEKHRGEKVYLIDWYEHTKTLDIFFEDNIHPGEEGAKILAQLMLRAMIEAGE